MWTNTQRWQKKVRVAVNNTYLNKDSLYYANNTVTANTLALSFKIPHRMKSEVKFLITLFI